MRDVEATLPTHSVVEKYATIGTKINMHLSEAVDLSLALAGTVRESGDEFDHVIGIANGALLPTKVVADELELPFQYIRMRRQGSRLKRRVAKIPGARSLFSALFRIQFLARLVRPVIDGANKLESEAVERSNKPYQGWRILLVDDAIESGQSIAAAEKLLISQGAVAVKTAVIGWSSRLDSQQNHGVVPDYVLNRRLQHYPWSENNPEVHQYRAWLKKHGLEEWD